MAISVFPPLSLPFPPFHFACSRQLLYYLLYAKEMLSVLCSCSASCSLCCCEPSLHLCYSPCLFPFYAQPSTCRLISSIRPLTNLIFLFPFLYLFLLPCLVILSSSPSSHHSSPCLLRLSLPFSCCLHLIVSSIRRVTVLPPFSLSFHFLFLLFSFSSPFSPPSSRNLCSRLVLFFTFFPFSCCLHRVVVPRSSRLVNISRRVWNSKRTAIHEPRLDTIWFAFLFVLLLKTFRKSALAVSQQEERGGRRKGEHQLNQILCFSLWHTVDQRFLPRSCVFELFLPLPSFFVLLALCVLQAQRGASASVLPPPPLWSSSPDRVVGSRLPASSSSSLPPSLFQPSDDFARQCYQDLLTLYQSVEKAPFSLPPCFELSRSSCKLFCPEILSRSFASFASSLTAGLIRKESKCHILTVCWHLNEESS